MRRRAAGALLLATLLSISLGSAAADGYAASPAETVHIKFDVVLDEEARREGSFTIEVSRRLSSFQGGVSWSPALARPRPGGSPPLMLTYPPFRPTRNGHRRIASALPHPFPAPAGAPRMGAPRRGALPGARRRALLQRVPLLPGGPGVRAPVGHQRRPGRREELARRVSLLRRRRCRHFCAAAPLHSARAACSTLASAKSWFARRRRRSCSQVHETAEGRAQDDSAGQERQDDGDVRQVGAEHAHDPGAHLLRREAAAAAAATAAVAAFPESWLPEGGTGGLRKKVGVACRACVDTCPPCPSGVHQPGQQRVPPGPAELPAVREGAGCGSFAGRLRRTSGRGSRGRGSSGSESTPRVASLALSGSGGLRPALSLLPLPACVRPRVRGQVVDGEEVVRNVTARWREQPNQGEIQARGNAYLDAKFPGLSYVRRAYRVGGGAGV